MMTFSIQQFVFTIFATVAIGSGLMVVTQRNPVRSALFLVLTFFACSGIWILAHAEFLALVLILVYVGAVMTLFLFVVMMLNIDVATVKGGLLRHLPMGIFIVALLVGLMFMALRPEYFSHIKASPGLVNGLTNTQALGMLLYTHYVYPFILAGVLLLVAIIAAISLSHRPPRNCKTQQTVAQIRVRREDCVRLVKMKAESK